MSRMIGSLAVLATVTALLALAPAASAKGCRVGDERSYGTTYVLSISVSDTSCRSGRKVIRAFHDCRPGKSGKCGSRVLRLLVLGEPLQQGPDVIRLARDVRQGRQDGQAHVHAVALASSPKSRRMACSTTSAANSAPLALRWMPSGSRTIWRRPSISMASR